MRYAVMPSMPAVLLQDGTSTVKGFKLQGLRVFCFLAVYEQVRACKIRDKSSRFSLARHDATHGMILLVRSAHGRRHKKS